MTGADQDKSSFGDKLTYLIETVHPPDRGPYSYREIAAGIAGHPGAMTAAHLHQLVTGKQPHPRIHYVEALASFFGVPVTYFFDGDTAARVDSQLALATALRDAGVRDVALRISNLDDANRQSILRIVQEITQMYSSASGGGPTAVEPEQPQD